MKPMSLRTALALAACLGAALPSLAQAPAVAPVETPAQPRSYGISDGMTPGGIRLVHLPLPGEKDQVFALGWRDRLVLRQPEKAGLLTLAAGLVADGGAGALDAGALEEELRDLGAGLSLFRTRAATFGQVSAPAGEFEAAAMLLRSVLTEPRLPKISLERQKRFRLNDVRTARERASSIAQQALALSIVGDHPIAATIAFRPESTITSVEVADVEAWRKAVLAKGNLTVVSAGPMQREAAAALADRVFDGLPLESREGEMVPFTLPAPKAKTIVVERPVEQSVIVAGGPLRWRAGGEEGVSRSLAMSALGGGNRSRLFVAIREKLGAAYGASAGVSPLQGSLGVLAMEAAVGNDRVAEALAAMRSEYAGFRAQGVSAEEIEPVKRRMLNGLAETMRRPGPAAAAIRAAIFNGLPANAPDRQAAWIRRQTPEGVNALIRERLPEALTVVVVTPKAEGLGADCVIASLDDLARCL
jgi:zinc protease